MPKTKPNAQANSFITQADVLIVGAGIVGQTLALALANLKLDTALSVVVLDAQESLIAKPCKADMFSSRVSAISKASQATFEALDVWSKIRRMQAYTKMQVWERDSFGDIRFAADDIGHDDLGHIIENEHLTECLYHACAEYAEIKYLLGQKIEQLQYQDAAYQIKLSGGDILSTKLLVGADGANSFVRSQLGFAQTFWDYEHTAIVANVQTELAHNQTAYQAFSPTGPLAFLPLPDSKQCSIVWSQDTEQATSLLALSDDEFCKALAVAVDMKLGACKLNSARASFPLRMRYARQWVDESVVLVGDAAHTIHPLAGQGANLGIADAIALAQNIEQSINNKKAFHAKRELRRYERYRKAEAQKVIATMEGFKRLFAGNNDIKKLIRSAGLSAANRFTPIKQFFIDQASG